LARNMANMIPSSKTYAVFAMLKDKDVAGVVREMALQVDVWLLAGIASPRGASAEELRHIIKQELSAGEILIFHGITEAFHHACKAAGENDRIVTFGSFYTVAEAMSVNVA